MAALENGPESHEPHLTDADLAALLRVIPGLVDDSRDIIAENGQLLAGVTDWFDAALLDPDQQDYVRYIDVNAANRARIVSGLWLGEPILGAPIGNYGFEMGDVISRGSYWAYARIDGTTGSGRQIQVASAAYDLTKEEIVRISRGLTDGRCAQMHCGVLACLPSVTLQPPSKEVIAKIRRQLIQRM